MKNDKLVGITSTLPIEIIYAAGKVPADLNNLFINSKDPLTLISSAERLGYPDTCCSWIKGIFSFAVEDPRIEMVVGVAEGDCSNTCAMLETLTLKKKKILEFSFPKRRDIKELEAELLRFADNFNAADKDILYWKQRLDKVREKLRVLDEMTYLSMQVAGEENHLWLVSASDMNSDPDLFERRLDDFLETASTRKPAPRKLRIGFVGVPPFMKNIYRELEKHDAGVVFNEVQRQFAMLTKTETLAEQYINFTYPYSIFDRLEDIKREVKLREIDGIIHYTQTFCHRAIQDIVLRENLNVPVLRIEGNDQLNLNAKQRTQIEAFCDMLEKGIKSS